jgi:hypothetical protein
VNELGQRLHGAHVQPASAYTSSALVLRQKKVYRTDAGENAAPMRRPITACYPRSAAVRYRSVQ